MRMRKWALFYTESYSCSAPTPRRTRPARHLTGQCAHFLESAVEHRLVAAGVEHQLQVVTRDVGVSRPAQGRREGRCGRDLHEPADDSAGLGVAAVLLVLPAGCEFLGQQPEGHEEGEEGPRAAIQLGIVPSRSWS